MVTNRHNEEVFVGDAALFRSKLRRVENGAAMMVDSYKKLQEEYRTDIEIANTEKIKLQERVAEAISRNSELQFELARATTHRNELRNRAESSKQSVSRGDITKEGGIKTPRDINEASTNKDKKMSISDADAEAALDANFRLVEEEGVATSTVSLASYKELRKVYLRMKCGFKALQTKFVKNKIKMKNMKKALINQLNERQPFAVEERTQKADEATLNRLPEAKSLEMLPQDLPISVEKHVVREMEEEANLKRTPEVKSLDMVPQDLPIYVEQRVVSEKEDEATLKRMPDTESLDMVPQYLPISVEKRVASEKGEGSAGPTNDNDGICSAKHLHILNGDKEKMKKHSISREPTSCVDSQRSRVQEETNDAEKIMKVHGDRFNWVSVCKRHFSLMFTLYF